ncbi:hypothetical protein F4777DRAFT_580141 [Nemania sp. FL0916]|nr:hypothetical protein F4777DRAFT_580141 [Nemania sp. FL0916]
MDVVHPAPSAVPELNEDGNAITSSSPKLNIYVDEAGGSDDSSTPGTKEKPFQTLFAAYVAFPPESIVPSPSYFTRVPKLDVDGQVDTAAVGWREPAKSAIKKAASRYAEHLKKTAKQMKKRLSVRLPWSKLGRSSFKKTQKYGSSPHGGYGMGLERFLAWILKRHSVRECVPFPRYPGKCTP